MTLIFETGAEAYLDYRQIFFREQLLRSLDALLHEELLRRHTGGFSERACEVELTEVGHGRDLRQTQIGIQIFENKILNASKLMTRKSAAHDLL